MLAEDVKVAPVIIPRTRSGHALIVGGTRGIGKAIADRLNAEQWFVTATGRRQFYLDRPGTWGRFFGGLPAGYQFDLVVFSAGNLEPMEWNAKDWQDYEASYALHALGPVQLLAYGKDSLFPWWMTVVFISTVGATNAGAVDLAYGMSKAALEKAARALGEHTSWKVISLQLDLVNTAMLKKLPVDTLHGRRIMEPEEAAEIILRKAGVLPPCERVYEGD